MKYYVLLAISLVCLITNIIASGIVDSYVIDAPNYQQHLIFTDPPYDKSDISDLDKLIYAGKISAYPYVAVTSILVIILLLILLMKKKE